MRNKYRILHGRAEIRKTKISLSSASNIYNSRQRKANCSFTAHIFHLLAVLKAHELKCQNMLSC